MDTTADIAPPPKAGFGRIVLAFALAVGAAYVVATVVYTQFIASYMADMGYPLSLSERLAATSHDLVGMMGMYPAIIAVSFLIAFSVAGLIVKRAPGLRTTGYMLAGFVGVAAAILVLQAVFGMHPLAATRTFIGLFCQALAGAVGGWVFQKCLPRRA